MIITPEHLSGKRSERCQVCVIGSGAGGAVVAAELAEAGYDVLVLEEGGYHPTSSFSHDPLRMLSKLYRHAGGDSTLGDPPILFAEGRCVGGSTVVNGGICYRTPERVLHAWSLALGTLQLLPESMEAYFSRVEANLHVSEVPDTIIGEDGRRMQQAAERLGYHYSRVKRNIYACQGTNLCILGCPTGGKQSTLVSYIPRARRFGARILPYCRARRLTIDRGRVTSVQAALIEPICGTAIRELEIKADAVFVAAGALQTPALLHRSRLRSRLKAIGRYLFLHPNTKCIGVFDEQVKAWQGSIQAYQIDHFADEGYTFGSTFLPPGILALSTPLYGQSMAEFMQSYNHLSVWGVLVEDVHPGRVRFTRSGEPLPFYRITSEDRDRFREGIAKLCEIFLAAGVREILLPIHGFGRVRNEDDVRILRQARFKANALHLFTVHLMGTCRMGVDPKISVVGVDHRVHGMENLFICDASVFPGPIRVNPMITIMALATRAAEVFQERAKGLQRAA